jgi:hypothetical protein
MTFEFVLPRLNLMTLAQIPVVFNCASELRAVQHTFLAHDFTYNLVISMVSIAFALFISDDNSLPKGNILLELDWYLYRSSCTP